MKSNIKNIKKPIIFASIVFISVIFFLLISNSSFDENIAREDKIILGYCSTMIEDAIFLSEENNYELVRFGSALEVLYALKNNHIDKALIGRRAKKFEINLDTKETILESGYTLVSNKKDFVDYSQLFSIDIHTYLDRDFDFPVKKISKEDVFEKISEGKIVLISWEDWKDDFELVVVMSGEEKVKEFRGLFLYEN